MPTSTVTTYDREVAERMDALRRERPAETNWIGYAYAERGEGECVECDALRRLQAEDE